MPDDTLKDGDAGSHQSSTSVITGSININVLIAFIFGVVFLAIMLGFAVWFPNPEPFQVQVFMTVLSLAAAGVGALLPGVFHFQYQKMVRASGALALFGVVWFSQPAIVKSVVTLQTPSDSADAVIAQFLSDLDSKDPAKSYADLDPLAQQMFVPTITVWQQLYATNLGRLGGLQSRVLSGTNAATSPSGLPIGLYQTHTYLSKYEGIQGCRQEAVTVRATQEKKWQVFSYLISPTDIPC